MQHQPKLSPADHAELDRLFTELQASRQSFAGYPCNADFDYSPLFRFLAFPINNVGDPFMASNYHLNTQRFEREVLEFYGRLAHASPDNTWGYVTNGGTEGNLYGIYLAREVYPEGIVYYSEDTHYSVSKVLRMLHVRNVMIRSQPDGRIDLEDLRESLKIHRDVPPIIFANIGTTMKGAVDDLPGIRDILRNLAIQEFYIHADAALSGMILPFVDDPQPFDFRAGINSISVSGHKMIGAPIPCGIVMARKELVDRISRNIEYIGTLDTTVTGSRNGITPLFLWYQFHAIGRDGFRTRIDACLATAAYAVEKFQAIGVPAWRHRNSITVVFPRPSMDFIRRWQLAVQHESAHIITMPHVTNAMVDRICEDLRLDLAQRLPADLPCRECIVK